MTKSADLYLSAFLAKLKKSCFPKMGEWGFFIFFGFSVGATIYLLIFGESCDIMRTD